MIPLMDLFDILLGLFLIGVLTYLVWFMVREGFRVTINITGDPPLVKFLEEVVAEEAADEEESDTEDVSWDNLPNLVQLDDIDMDSLGIPEDSPLRGEEDGRG